MVTRHLDVPPCLKILLIEDDAQTAEVIVKASQILATYDSVSPGSASNATIASSAGVALDSFVNGSAVVTTRGCRGHQTDDVVRRDD